MKFLNGAPVFAVEVRSEGDYGSTAEQEMAQKRADYFAAGTLVVWDVDLMSEDVVRSYNVNKSRRADRISAGRDGSGRASGPGMDAGRGPSFP